MRRLLMVFVLALMGPYLSGGVNPGEDYIVKLSGGEDSVFMEYSEGPVVFFNKYVYAEGSTVIVGWSKGAVLWFGTDGTYCGYEEVSVDWTTSKELSNPCEKGTFIFFLDRGDIGIYLKGQERYFRLPNRSK